MRRWLTRILICFLLGVVTTVGLACGLLWAIAHADRFVIISDGNEPSLVTWPEALTVVDSAGWPVTALSRERDRSRIIYLTRDGVARAPARAPIRPIWTGFLIDTLFYGALWLGLIVGFGAARRKLRMRRGRCPLCAYDLRGDLDRGCPECGWNRAEDES